MTRIGIAGATGRQGKRWRDTVDGLGYKPVPFRQRTETPEEWVIRVPRVIIATPVESHYGIAGAALRAGKPVLCEKPLAATRKDVTNLILDAQLYKTRLWTCYPHLWHPSVEAMARREGPIDLEVTFCGPTEREPLLDWGPHALSTALYILSNDAALKSRVISEDRRRVSLELVSDRGRAWLLFGWAVTGRVSVQVKNQPRLYYNNENCRPTTMQRMLAAWLRSEDDPRGDPALTLGVHELLEEVIR